MWELLLASSQAMRLSLAEESVWNISSLHGCEEQESRVEVGRKLRSLSAFSYLSGFKRCRLV